MAKAVMNLASVSNYFASCPPRIQDVPNHILKMYGIMVVSDECYESSDDENALVIDERPSPVPSPEIFIQTAKKPKLSPKNNEPPAIVPRLESLLNTRFKNCATCSTLIAESCYVNHVDQHCFQRGCPDMLLTDEDRAKHIKMHSHPTKPFLCLYCRKRDAMEVFEPKQIVLIVAGNLNFNWMLKPPVQNSSTASHRWQ